MARLFYLPHMEQDAAFNAGSDARLSGLPLGANPYQEGDGLYRFWRRGWRHVDLFWGVDGRGVARRLRTVGCFESVG